ncbi:MAG: hypothetical protein ACYDBY_13505 [Thermoanaerobaculia bacterium]
MQLLPTARLTLIALSLAAAPSAATAPAEDGASLPPHPTWRLDACSRCHAPSESELLEARLSRPCASLCATCHDDRETHHPSSVRVSGLRAPLLLTSVGKLTCSTCHDVTAPRHRETAWTSRSLVDRLAPRKGPHPTRLLAMKNDRGQLCRSCH